MRIFISYTIISFFLASAVFSDEKQGRNFVDLPDVGASLSKGDSFGSVESVKAVEDMYAPIDGEVVQRNEAVLASPEELQNDPHGEGWLLVIRPGNASQMESLLDAAAYSAKVNAS